MQCDVDADADCIYSAVLQHRQYFPSDMLQLVVPANSAALLDSVPPRLEHRQCIAPLTNAACDFKQRQGTDYIELL
jgi:hypothetical protein